MSNITTNGYNASITLTDSGVLIKPNFMGSVLNKETALSEKFIPYSSISGINLTKGIPIIRDGFLQINTKGEVDTNDNKVNQQAKTRLDLLLL